VLKLALLKALELRGPVKIPFKDDRCGIPSSFIKCRDAAQPGVPKHSSLKGSHNASL
jgi:hypothetical protein